MLSVTCSIVLFKLCVLYHVRCHHVRHVACFIHSLCRSCVHILYPVADVTCSDDAPSLLCSSSSSLYFLFRDHVMTWFYYALHSACAILLLLIIVFKQMCNCRKCEFSVCTVKCARIYLSDKRDFPTESSVLSGILLVIHNAQKSTSQQQFLLYYFARVRQ